MSYFFVGDVVCKMYVTGAFALLPRMQQPVSSEWKESVLMESQQ